jgi:Domain of unknown function (DUF4173)
MQKIEPNRPLRPVASAAPVGSIVVADEDALDYEIDDPNFDYAAAADASVPALTRPPRPTKPLMALKPALTILVIAFGLGWLADLLFYNKSFGINFPLFTGLLTLALIGVSLREKGVLARRNLWLLVPLGFFATMVFVRANALLTTINMLMVIVVFSLLLYFYAADRLERLSLLDYPIVLSVTAGNVLFRQPAAIRTGIVSARKSQSFWRTTGSVMRGLLLALPVVGVFTWLLASADTIFSQQVEIFFSPRVVNMLTEAFGHLVVIGIGGWLVAGILGYGLDRLNQKNREAITVYRPFPGLRKLQQSIGFTETITTMGLLCLLFAAFDYIQFTQLFSGQASRTMNAVEYKQYVHRGFAELLVTASLTLALVLCVQYMARTVNSKQLLALRAVSTALVALALVILVSAFQRMILWESVEAYLDTGLRVYVRSFILWLGIAFGWLLVAVWLRPKWFAIGGFVALLGFVATINLVNPDDDVVRSNLARFEANPAYNVANIMTPGLSEDAIPALVEAFQTTKNPQMVEFLKDELGFQYARLERNGDVREWAAFHLSRLAAYDRLKKLMNEGVLYRCHLDSTCYLGKK